MVERIKSIEYHANGLVKCVEFYSYAPLKPFAIYTLTKTIEDKTTIVCKNASLASVLRQVEK